MSTYPAMSRSNMTACMRCRQRKKKCDQRLPKCRLCEAAGVDCVTYDNVAGRQVPRSYVHALEERVAELELRLRECRCGAGDQSVGLTPVQAPTPTVASSQPTGSSLASTSPAGLFGSSTGDINMTADARATSDAFASLSYRRPGQEPTLSRILLAEVVRSKPFFHQTDATTQAVGNTTESQVSSDLVGHLDTGPVSLPSRDAAQSLITSYFRLTNAAMPLLHEPTFMTQVNRLYSLPHTIDLTNTHADVTSKVAVFFVLEVFAVAILSMQKQEPSAVPTWWADRYHKGAVAALKDTPLPSDVEGVQVLLLLAQYSYHHPTLWAVWNTVGAALRLAVELRLHQDPPPGSMDTLALDVRRRAFWVAYSMDRNLSTALDLPTCLADEAISVELRTRQFPTDVDDSCITSEGITVSREQVGSGLKRIALYIFRYRRIQSALQTVLYQRQPVLNDDMGLVQWQLQMRERIDSWYRDVPSSTGFDSFGKGILEAFEVTYNTALLNLYRPSPSIPSPTEPQIEAMAQAATRMIELYKRFFRERRLTIYWQSVENISSAGMALMYGYAHSPKLRAAMAFSQLESTIHACSSVLWGMVERFPSFRGKQDAFDMVASKTLTDLGASYGTAWETSQVSPESGTTAADAMRFHHSQVPFLTPRIDDSVVQAGMDPLDFRDMDVGDLDWDSLASGNIPFPTA